MDYEKSYSETRDFFGDQPDPVLTRFMERIDGDLGPVLDTAMAHRNDTVASRLC